MANVTSRARFEFDSSSGYPINMNVPRANPALTGEQAKAAMDEIIDSEAKLTANGRPIDVRSARLITTERRSLI